MAQEIVGYSPINWQDIGTDFRDTEVSDQEPANQYNREAIQAIVESYRSSEVSETEALTLITTCLREMAATDPVAHKTLDVVTASDGNLAPLLHKLGEYGII